MYIVGNIFTGRCLRPMLTATHVKISSCFRSGTFKISVACLQPNPKPAVSAETSLPARTPTRWNRFTLRPTAWLRSPWRRGCPLAHLPRTCDRIQEYSSAELFRGWRGYFFRGGFRQKGTDDSEDCLQRIHSTLPPCRRVILDFFFFALRWLHFTCSPLSFIHFNPFPVEGRGLTAAWQFLIMSL